MTDTAPAIGDIGECPDCGTYYVLHDIGRGPGAWTKIGVQGLPKPRPHNDLICKTEIRVHPTWIMKDGKIVRRDPEGPAAPTALPNRWTLFISIQILLAVLALGAYAVFLRWGPGLTLATIGTALNAWGLVASRPGKEPADAHQN